MWPFRTKLSGLSPTAVNNAVRHLVNGELNQQPEPSSRQMTFSHYSGYYLSIGGGLQAKLTQTANEVLRHCRIGRIVLKAR